MYEAKRAGGDRVVAYTPSVEVDPEVDPKGWIGLGADLKSAIEAGGLRLAYQPIIDAGSGEALEVEALARWDHPERGPIPPEQFVAVAERSGLINALGSWILQRALDDVEHWRAAGIELGVHVNVSVRQLAMDGFAQTVVEEVERRGLRRGVITIELTESLLARDLPRVREDLVRLRGSGIRVSLDDFGTGYSSIGYLESLPLDEIKVDKAMTLGIVDDRRRLSILRGSRALARGLGLAFVVEGVEDERTWDLLETLGDCRMQGYGVGRPMPADALAGWLATHRERVQARRAAQQAVAVGRSLSAQRQIEVSARSAPSLDSLMGNLWHELRDVVPYDRIGVALLEDDGRILRARWARATYSEALRISHGYSAPMAASSLAEILRTGKPRIIGDLVQHLARNPDSMSTRLIVGEGVRSSLTCPLIVGDTAVGFLFFSSREPDAYHDAHVSSFQSLAELVSGSVAQVRAMPRLFADALSGSQLPGFSGWDSIPLT
jgi:EAL domain-containing protein (putative c-di-GMP-specific phosphodiesterase class I)